MSKVNLVVRFMVFGILISGISLNIIADDPFRVVVQDARPVVIAASFGKSAPNFRNREQSNLELVLAVDANYRSKHIFYAIDPRSKSLTHVINFPERIVGAAIAKSKNWFLVSGETRLYRVDAKTGSYQPLLQNTSGQIAISDDESTIAVLGRFNEEVPLRRASRTSALKLGLFNIEEEKWIVETQTPVQIPEQVYFDKKSVVGVGVGGRVFSRAASSFPCHTVIDTSNKKSESFHGVETRFGRPPTEDNYQLPDKAVLNRSQIQLCRQLIPDAVANLNPAPRSGPLGPFVPLMSKDKSSALIRVNRIANDRWKQATFVISQKGKISVTSGAGNGSTPVRFGHDVFVQEYLERDTDRFTNLVTGTQTRHPRVDDSGASKIRVKQFLTRCGCLLHLATGEFKMLELGGAVRWQRKGFESYKRLGQIAVSNSGSLFAFTQNENDIHVLSSRDGKTILKINRPENADQKDFRYTRSICFNDNETQLAVLFDRDTHVYDLSTGKIIHSVTCEKKDYIQKVFAVANRWLLSGFQHCRFWNPGKELGEPIRFSDVSLIRPFERENQNHLILQNEKGEIGILNCESGELLITLLAGNKGPNVYQADPIPTVATYFDDRVIIVPTGHSAQFKLLRTTDFSVIATVQPVPVGGNLGWIIYSNDGYWDASAGAAIYVFVFKGKEKLSGFSVKSRFKKDLLANLLGKYLK